MTSRSVQPIIAPIFSALLVALVTWPVWRWLWGEWWSNDYYSHGLLIGPVALYLAWRRIRNGGDLYRRGDPGDSRGLLLLAGSLAIYLLFYSGKAIYLASFATIGLLAGLLWTFGGSRTLGQLAFPLGYLALMVPLPFVERITLPLALWTGVSSGGFVRWLGLDVTITGAAVTLPNTELIIGAQCSGINSIMALTALTTLVAYLVQGPLWGRLALVALSLPIALLGNILRVSNLLFVARYFGAEAAFHFYHDYSGLVFFGLVMVLLAPLAHLFRCRTLRIEVL